MIRVSVITSLFNCERYLTGYFEAVNSIENKHEIEILLLHNEPKAAELAIINKFLPGYGFIRHIIVSEREGLYSTWNRGITLANGRYITTWNVDDTRLPDSISRQADALDQHSTAAISYGNFVIVDTFGKKEGKIMIAPEFNVKDRSFFRQHHIGCFPMWRKDIHKSIGYFDEQFRLIADLDFQIRVAKKYPLIKTDTNLGYYLEGTPFNLSSNFSTQDMEHAALHLRYANLDLLMLPYLWKAIKTFKIFQYKWFGTFHNMVDWSERDLSLYFLRSPMILASVFKLPRHLARRYLKKFLNRMINKYFKRKPSQIQI